MLRKWLAAMVMLGLAVATANAQDAKTVLGNASKAMGVDGLNSIYFYGTAQAGNLGQNNNSNQPWPMAAQNDYVRAIDFSQPASRATWATYAVPVTGGRAALAQGTPQTQQPLTPQTQGRGGEQCDCQSAERRRQAVSGGDLELAGQVTGRAGLQAGWLHQQPEPGRTSADVGRESDLWRHARRDGVLELSGQQRSQVSCDHRPEAGWMADD